MRRAEDADNRPRQTAASSAQQAFLVLGIPSLGFGLGFAMIQINFWVGVILMLLFLPLFWWLISRVFTEEEPIKRLFGVLGSIGIIWAIWVPASIRVVFDNEAVDHPAGDRSIRDQMARRLFSVNHGSL